MSNCIELAKHVVFFKTSEIDVEKFRTFLESIPEKMPEGHDVDNGAWWYLATNTTFMSDGVEIRFGAGRSSHTWRDFRYVVNKILNPYMKGKKGHRFICRDESDGFRDSFVWDVVFGEEMK
jgi:hypothetical protein